MTKHFVPWNNTNVLAYISQGQEFKILFNGLIKVPAGLHSFLAVVGGNPFGCLFQLLENRSCVVGRRCLLKAEHSLDKILLALALLHLYSKTKLACSAISWLSTFVFQSPHAKDIFFFFLVLDFEGLLGLWRTSQLQLLWPLSLGHGLEIQWCWMVCHGSELRSFCHLWDCTQVYCISDSFVDYESYSLSSKGFLPTVGDIMAIWINFSHSHPI